MISTSLNKCFWYTVFCNVSHLVFVNLIYLHLQYTKNEYFHANEITYCDCYIYAILDIWNKSGRDDTGGDTFTCINI